MGGSGGGGSFSSSDMQKIQAAAEERLKALASKSTKVLFVCDATDKKSLEAHLAKSTVFKKDRCLVGDSSDPKKAEEALSSSTFLVAYTDAATSISFVDDVIDQAMAKKIGCVHAKANAKAKIPAKITAYRIRSITWTELEAIFK